MTFPLSIGYSVSLVFVSELIGYQLLPAPHGLVWRYLPLDRWVDCVGVLGDTIGVHGLNDRRRRVVLCCVYNHA